MRREIPSARAWRGRAGAAAGVMYFANNTATLTVTIKGNKVI